MVKGPKGFSWGGSWICAAAGTDNIELIRNMMLNLTCDTHIAYRISTELGDFTNNNAAMGQIANSDLTHDFLGGQNHIAVLLDSAQSITRKNISPYDQGMLYVLQDVFHDYFTGNITENDAWDKFYYAVKKLYPELNR